MRIPKEQMFAGARQQMATVAKAILMSELKKWASYNPSSRQSTTGLTAFATLASQ
jgi:hypothetical protein